MGVKDVNWCWWQVVDSLLGIGMGTALFWLPLYSRSSILEVDREKLDVFDIVVSCSCQWQSIGFLTMFTILYLCCVCVTRVHWYAYLQWFWGSVFLRRWFVFIPWPSCYNWITNEMKLLIVLRPIFKGTCISPVNDMQLEKVYARICFPTVACCCYRLQLDVCEQVFLKFLSRFIS